MFLLLNIKLPLALYRSRQIGKRSPATACFNRRGVIYLGG